MGQIQDLRFEMVNPAAEKLIGRKASNLFGRTLLEELPSARKNGLFERLSHIIEENLPLDFEHQFQVRGFSRWYRLAGVKLEDGAAVSFLKLPRASIPKCSFWKLRIAPNSQTAPKANFWLT